MLRGFDKNGIRPTVLAQTSHKLGVNRRFPPTEALQTQKRSCTPHSCYCIRTHGVLDEPDMSCIWIVGYENIPSCWCFQAVEYA